VADVTKNGRTISLGFSGNRFRGLGRRNPTELNKRLATHFARACRDYRIAITVLRSLNYGRSQFRG
jgi:hypothetical protein